MKKTLTILILQVAMAIPVSSETFTFSTNNFVLTKDGWRTGIGVSTPFFNTTYTTDGFGVYYPPRHRVRHAPRRHKSVRHALPPYYYYHPDKDRRHHIKKMIKRREKAEKEYRKEMKKQWKKEAKRHHRHRHHDDD